MKKVLSVILVSLLVLGLWHAYAPKVSAAGRIKITTTSFRIPVFELMRKNILTRTETDT